MVKREINKMFSEMRLYEFRNVVFSFGQNLLWRRDVIKLSRGKLLDVATGPGIIPGIYKRDFSVGLDISLSMLKKGKRRAVLVLGDGEELPFKSDSFDTITIAFGLRNIPNKEKALREFYRVLKCPGRLLILEMKADLNFWDLPNLAYLTLMIFLSPIFGGSVKDYLYLFKSIIDFPDDNTLRDMLISVGFKRVRVKRFAFGPTRLFYAEKCWD
ncbi:MAG: class I SAM-dependent methyltransferase [candidate division WOR-3 bacterium]